MNETRTNAVLTAALSDEAEITIIKNDTWSDVNVSNISSVRVTFNVLKFDKNVARPAIILLDFLSDDRSSIDSNHLYYRSSAGYSFVYFESQNTGLHYLDLPIPEGASTMTFSIQPWGTGVNPLVLGNSVSFSIIPQAQRHPTLKIQNLTEQKSNPKLNDVSPPTLESQRKTLTSNPIWFEFHIKETRSLAAEINLAIAEADSKAAVCRVEFLNANGTVLPTGSWLANSPVVGSFFYAPTGKNSSYKKSLFAPKGTTKIRLGIQSWNASGPILLNPIKVLPAKTSDVEKELGISIDDLKEARDIKVAFIVDEFTYNSFKYECDAIVLTPSNWREEMAKHQPDLLFCESAWSGTDSVKRPWKGRIYGSTNFPKENRTDLFEIVEYCNNQDIPTVFWNKEDPTHFNDRIHDFVDTATRFDYVFTTAQECVNLYRDEYGIKNVDVLPFATQPRLFNPAGGKQRSSAVTFAGAWYANHEKRCVDTAAIFDIVLGSGKELRIFDRFHGNGDELHEFPEKYRRFTMPPLAHDNVASAYKMSDFGININTVVDSPTMFARRVFELASCNTMIISNPAEGLSTFFDDEILIINADDDYAENVEKLRSFDSESIKQAALVKVLSEHTYRHRFAKVLESVGIDYSPINRKISLVCRIRNADEAKAAVTCANRLGDIVESVVLLVSDEVEATYVPELYQDYNKFGVRVVSLEAWKRYGVYEGIGNSRNDVLIIDATKLEVIGSDRIKKMLVHREYSEDILAYTDKAETRYTFSDSTESDIVLIPSNYFDLAVVENRQIKGLIYNV